MGHLAAGVSGQTFALSVDSPLGVNAAAQSGVSFDLSMSAPAVELDATVTAQSGASFGLTQHHLLDMAGVGQSQATFNASVASGNVNLLSMTAAGVSTFTYPDGRGLVLAGVQQDTPWYPFPHSDVKLRFDVGVASVGVTDWWPEWSTLAGVQSVDIRRGADTRLGSVSPGAASIRIAPTNRFLVGSSMEPYATLRRQIRVHAFHDGSTYPLYRGFVSGIRHEYGEGEASPNVTIDALDAFSLMASMPLSTSTYAQQYAHERIADMLDAVSWPSVARSITTENDGLLGPRVFTRSIDMLSGLQKAGEASWGPPVFIDAAGRVAMKTDSTLDSSVVTVGSSAHPMQRVEVEYDINNMWNVAEVASVGDDSAFRWPYVLTTGSQARPSYRSITRFGELRRDATALWTRTGTQQQYYSQVYVNARTGPIPVIRFTLPAVDQSTDAGALLGADLYDRIAIANVTGSSFSTFQPFITSLGYRIDLLASLWEVDITGDSLIQARAT